MKYMINGSFQSRPLMKVTIIATLVFLSIFWVTTLVMYFSKMGLTPDSVVTYYRGSETAFTPARTFGSMLEVTHGHLPVMALVALLLTHLFIFSAQSHRIKMGAIIVLFGSALASEAASWLVRFVHPLFAYLKIAAFLALELSMAYVIWALVIMMSRGKEKTAISPAGIKKADDAHPHSPPLETNGSKIYSSAKRSHWKK